MRVLCMGELRVSKLCVRSCVGVVCVCESVVCGRVVCE